MAKPSSTKIHATMGGARSLCGHGNADTIKAFTDFFAQPEDGQCASCLAKIAKRGYRNGALRRRYQGEPKVAPARPAKKRPSKKPAADTGLYGAVKRTAMDLFDKTLRAIERSQTDILRFERLCLALTAQGYEFAHRVTPQPYGMSYSIKLNAAQSRRLGDLLGHLSNLGYADHDPAFPSISGMKALEITGPDNQTFTLNYVRQDAHRLDAHARRELNHHLKELHHAQSLDI